MRADGVKASSKDSFPGVVRETTWPVLALAAVASIGGSLLVNLIAGPPGSDFREALGAVERATGGVVQTPLVLSPLFFVIVGAVMFGVGRLRLSDVGWRVFAAGPALIATLAFWAAMQAGLVVWVVLSSGELHWNESWDEMGAGWFFGQLLAQLLGNALVEETVFRGFFLPQLYLKALARFRPASALVLALMTSQLFFALMHIPNRLFVNAVPIEDQLVDQLELIAQGLTYGALYVVTRNIFVGVGLHSLYNQPARLLPVPFRPAVMIVWYVLAFTLLVSWSLVTRSMEQPKSGRDGARGDGVEPQRPAARRGAEP